MSETASLHRPLRLKPSWRHLVVGLMAVVALAACSSGGSGADSSTASSDPGDRSGGQGLDQPGGTGDDGSELRIVALQGNIAEIVIGLGLRDSLVGRDVSATFEGAEALPLVTTAHDVSAEAVLSVHPTVVLADDETGPPEALDQIRRAGVSVLVFERPTSVGDVIPRIVAVAEALGVPEVGSALAAETERELAAATEGLALPASGEAPTVAFLYVRGQAGVYLIGGPGAGTDSMIEAAGAVDAGTAIGLEHPFTPLTAEALVTAAPDVILVTDSGLESVGGIDGLVALNGVGQTPAGRNRRVVALEDGLLFNFGPRTPEAVRFLAEAIHQAVARP